MDVNIRGLRALLSRDGTHRFDQAGDSPGGLFCVVKQRLNLQPQGDPPQRVAESVLWQKFAQRNQGTHFQSGADERGSDFPGVSHPSFAQPCCEHILRIALLDRMILPASRRVLQNLAHKCDQPIPVFMLKRVVQPMGDRLDRLNYFAKLHCDALRGGGRVIQFMRKTGGHCSERLQLLLLLRRTF